MNFRKVHITFCIYYTTLLFSVRFRNPSVMMSANNNFSYRYKQKKINILKKNKANKIEP